MNVLLAFIILNLLSYLEPNEANESLNQDLCDTHIGLQHQHFVREKRSPSFTCSTLLCQNGAWCSNGKCNCLRHYRGRYCEEMIDYCLENPCRNGARCIGRLGGYTCECKQNFAGRHCENIRQHPVRSIKRPDFLYQPLQYVGFDYYYVVHMVSKGNHPVMEVDFGDGTILKQSHLVELKNAYHTLERYFLVTLNISSSHLEAFVFNHTYKSSNIYVLKITIEDYGEEVFNTEYEVRVIAAHNCSLHIDLHNAATVKEKPLLLYRSSSINFMSSAWSSCMQIQLKYRWRLHKVNTFEDVPTKRTVYKPANGSLNLQEANLEILPFTLDFGSYVAVLSVVMLKPRLGIGRNISTWFQVARKPVVAHIQGGRKLSTYSDLLFFLDASFSYDPNYGESNQPNLSFTWACEPRGDFCGGKYLKENCSELIIPSNVMPLGEYKFQVWVSSEGDPTTSQFTGIAEQTVNVVNTDQPLFRLKCLRNCLGGRSNPTRVVAFRGISMAAFEENRETVTSWVVYLNPETNYNIAMRLNDTDIMDDERYVLFYEQQFKPGMNYKILFTGYNTDTPIFNRQKPHFADIQISTYRGPEAGTCAVHPQRGYSMITTFTVTCSGFSSGDDSKELRYEVLQFIDLKGIKRDGLLVGYDSSGIIKNITLPPGSRKYGYLTVLRVVAISSQGLTAHFDSKVTVLPLLHYVKIPDEVLQYCINVGSGLASPLNVLLNGGNYIELVQQIVSVTSTLKQFWGKEYDFYAEKANEKIEHIQNTLTSYLHLIPIMDIRSLKHTATALDEVLDLYSSTKVWKIRIVTAEAIVKRMMDKLDHLFAVSNVDQADMDDFGIILLSIASKILRTPTSHQQVLREDHVETKNVFLRHYQVDQINPFDIQENILHQYDSSNLIEFIERYMRLYLLYKMPNERATLISSKKVSIVIKKAAPEFLTTTSLALSEKVIPRLMFEKPLYGTNSFINLKMIIMDNNPNWYEYDDSLGHRFPFVKINLTNEADGTPVNAEMEVDVSLIKPIETEVINGTLPVTLFWKIEEKHIQVHSIAVPKQSKLLVTFLPVKNNYKLRMVLKKNARPLMEDFWYNGITIPQKVLKKARDKGMSVFADDDLKETGFYYLGVLPHVDTLKDMMRDIEEPVLPHMFHYDDPMHDETDFEDYYGVSERSKREVFAGFGNTPQTTKRPDEIRRLPYSFTAQAVRCVTWNDSSKHWQSNCDVKAGTSSTRVTCGCPRNDLLSATFQRVSVEPYRYSEFRYYISYNDNPLIPFLAIFTLILFIGLFKWAAEEDQKDKARRTVCFLIDNYPQCEYTYLVIVHTGQKIKAGTTSNVAIELEGTVSTSLPHVLKDWTRGVLERSGRDWFVLKTTRCLGEIYCLHIWTDYSGARPSWYCDKIIIHDIQEQQVWFFLVDKWFDPINGDGTMSYTIYQSTDDKIFSVPFQLRENVNKEFESGMHGWFSIFYKHPYSNYTRKQRVGVAYTHSVLIMLILIFLHEFPASDSPGDQLYKDATYKWEFHDVTSAIIAVIIALPFHYIIVWFFRCIKPSTQWTESRLDSNFSRFNIESSKNLNVLWMSPQSISKTNIHPPKRRQQYRKKVSFGGNTYDLEDIHDKIRSRHSVEKLEKKAGTEKVVPLRLPTSKVETEEPIASDLAKFGEGASPPIYGQEVVTQSYCLPQSFIFVAWLLLFFIVVPCVYVIVYYGLSYGWIASLHYLFSLFLAIIFSMFLVEPLKLLFSAVYLFFYNKEEYTVEDRSDLVETLNPEFEVPSQLQSYVVEKINKLRESPMYVPLKEEQVHKLNRNRLVNFMTRLVVADFMLLVMCVLLLLTVIYNIFDTFAYFHYTNVNERIAGSDALRRTYMEDVKTQQDLVRYLRDAVIGNLHYYNVSDEKMELKPVVDEVNYLIGVIRLRQIRKSPLACKGKGPKWSRRCVHQFDSKNYLESWNSDRESQVDALIIEECWRNQHRVHDLGDSFVRYNETKYPTNYYMATLSRSRQDSLAKFDYLLKKHWFNFLTSVVYADFVLYNPALQYLSLVTVMADRTQTGLFYLHSNVKLVKMFRPGHHGELYVQLILVISFLVLICYIFRESYKYSLARPRQLFSRKWDAIQKLLALLGIAVILIYINRTVNMTYYHERVSQATQEKFIGFGTIAFWESTLLVSIAVMLFLILIRVCQIFRTFYRINLAWTLVTKSFKVAGIFFIYVMIVTFALAMSGFVLFRNRSYYFQSVYTSIFTVFGSFGKFFQVEEFGNTVGITTIMLLYLMFLIVIFFFILRWLMASIIIHLYTAVKKHAHFGLYQPVLSSYSIKYLDSIDSSPNRKPLKLTLYWYSVEPKMRALGYLFVDFYTKITNKDRGGYRNRAMSAVAVSAVRRRYPLQQTGGDSSLQQYKREEQAKAISKTIITTNSLKNKLEYLGVKVDMLLRDARYDNMRKH